MYRVDQGVLIFNEWFESARGLSGLEFKKLFLAMYDYQVNGKTPPTFTPKGETLAKVVFPCIKKRIIGASNARSRSISENCSDGSEADSSSDGSTDKLPQRVPAGEKTGCPAPKEKKSKEKNSISPPLSPGTEGARRGRGGRKAATESEEEKKHWDEFFELAIKRATEIEDVKG